MILPIYGYGHSVLKAEAEEIDENYPNLKELIENMWETMYNANGIGLAAPQVGISIRLFVMDSIQSMEEEDKHLGIKKVFINPIIFEESGKPWDYEEGCLSIPNLSGDVSRKPSLKIEYYDENFNLVEEAYDGLNARVIQHETDHLDGILFTEKLKPIKRRRVKGKLEKIKKGDTDVEYPMRFFNFKR